MNLSTYNTNNQTFSILMSAGIETLRQAQVFLYVMRSGSIGRTVSDVCNDLGITQSASSRSMRLLSPEFNSKRKGLNLINESADKLDGRVKVFTLNEHGLKLAEELNR